MKPFDDEDLIAYHLHELSPRRARALESALQNDPSLAAESEAYAATLRSFKADVPLAVDEEILARNWRAVWPLVAAYRTRPTVRSRWITPALVGGALAFAATACFIVARHDEATRASQSSSMRQSDGASHSLPPFEGSSTTAAPIDSPMTAERGSADQRAGSLRLLSPSPTRRSQDAPHRRISLLPLMAERPPILSFIPFAPVGSAVLPAPFTTPTPAPLLSITAEPASAAQMPIQDKDVKSRHGRLGVHHEHTTDLTLAMGGTLIGTSDVNSSGGVTRSLSATHAVTAMASFHQQLRPALGYRIAVSYTLPDFAYSYKDATTTSAAENIDGRIYELAATYVVQGPHRGSLSTSVEAGAGLMGILQSQGSASASYNIRGAAVAGVAAEYALTKHLGLHAAYRAQFFKGPDFNSNGANTPVFTTNLLINEPSVGITYRFTRK